VALGSGFVDCRWRTGLAHLDLPLVLMPTLHASHASLTGVSFTLTPPPPPPPQWGAHEQEKGGPITRPLQVGFTPTKPCLWELRGSAAIPCAPIPHCPRQCPQRRGCCCWNDHRWDRPPPPRGESGLRRDGPTPRDAGKHRWGPAEGALGRIEGRGGDVLLGGAGSGGWEREGGGGPTFPFAQGGGEEGERSHGFGGFKFPILPWTRATLGNTSSKILSCTRRRHRAPR